MGWGAGELLEVLLVLKKLLWKEGIGCFIIFSDLKIFSFICFLFILYTSSPADCVIARTPVMFDWINCENRQNSLTTFLTRN